VFVLFVCLFVMDGVWMWICCQDVVRGGVHQRKRYWVTKLPRYLILHLARFTRNNFFVEKNPTIVNIPIKNLELKDCKLMPPVRQRVLARSCCQVVVATATDRCFHHHCLVSLADYFPESPLPNGEDLKAMSISQLRSFLTTTGVDASVSELLHRGSCVLPLLLAEVCHWI